MPWLLHGRDVARPRHPELGVLILALQHLEPLRHHPPTPWHEVPEGQARWDKIPVQEPVRGPRHSQGW